jgi:WD domain, G-beta repeat
MGRADVTAVCGHYRRAQCRLIVADYRSSSLVSEQPQPTDLVLSQPHPPIGGLVLGGRAGLQARFASPQVADRLAVLRELKARNAADTADWMMQALGDPEIAVQKLAYLYLSEQFNETAETALADYAHYQLFEPIATLTAHTQGVTAVTTGVRQFVYQAEQAIVISSDRLGTVHVWDLATQETTLSFPTWSFAYGLHYDADRDYLWMRAAQDHLLAWSLKTQQEVDWEEDQTLELPTAQLPPIRQIASVLRVDDRYLIGGNQRQIKIWDLPKAQQIKVLQGHRGLVNAVAISADRSCLVSGSEDCTVRLWGIA